MHAHPSKSSRAHLSPSSCVHPCVHEHVFKSFEPSGSQRWKSEASARTDFSGCVAQLWAIVRPQMAFLPLYFLIFFFFIVFPNYSTVASGFIPYFPDKMGNAQVPLYLPSA